MIKNLLKRKPGFFVKVSECSLGERTSQEDLTGSDRAAAARALNAFMQMTKFDIAPVQKAYEGK